MICVYVCLAHICLGVHEHYHLLLVYLFAAPEVDIANDKSTWISQELSKSDRPELTSAGKVVSGGQWALNL